MAEPRKPQDHKKKAEKKEAPGPRFSFEHDGETYTFETDTVDVLTPGFIRKNRHDEGEIFYGLVEQLATPEQLEVIDGMTFKENAVLQVAFMTYIQDLMGVELGE